MWIFKVLSIVFLIILTSFYFFPFEFTFLPGFNTKMIMAGIGLVLLLFRLGLKRNSQINKDFFVLSIWAGVVSLMGLLSVAWNDTNDYTYSTYIISMWVWTSAAYVLVSCMNLFHQKVSFRLLSNYLIVVCVFQCLLAYLMTIFPVLKSWVDSFLGGKGFMGKMDDRLYGIGAALDVAGTRFSVILILIVFLLTNIVKVQRKIYIWLYVVSFMIIGLIGNMMSRTTTIGFVIALCYFIYVSQLYKLKFSLNLVYIVKCFFVSLLVIIPFVIWKYNVDMTFQQHIRFAFEGFFSLAEQGEWDVHSNELLKKMYVFPEQLQTYIIGDGYFNNPSEINPHYTGHRWIGYYQDTDVGYLRFIYYFGLLGLLSFCIFMWKACRSCINRFSSFGNFFMMILVFNFIIWFKVSTDIFLVFALFLVCTPENEENSTGKNATCIEA